MSTRTAARTILHGASLAESIAVTSARYNVGYLRAEYPKWRAQGWPHAIIGGGLFNSRPGSVQPGGAGMLAFIDAYTQCSGYQQDVFEACLLKRYATSLAPAIPDVVSRVIAMAGGGSLLDSSNRVYRELPARPGVDAIKRNAIVAPFARSLQHAFTLSLKQTVTTNWHPASVVACALQTAAIWRMFEGVWDNDADAHYTRTRNVWTKWGKKERDPMVERWFAGVGQTAVNLAWSDASAINNTFEPIRYHSDRLPAPLWSLAVGYWVMRRASEDAPEHYTPDTNLYEDALNQLHGDNLIAAPALLEFGRSSDAATAGGLLAVLRGDVFDGIVAPDNDALSEFDRLMPAEQSETA
jgi:hypothetical protein